MDNTAEIDHREMDLNGAGNPLRHDRRHLIAFVTDTGSEQVLRASLSDMLPEPPDIRRGGIRAAHVAMLKTTSPRILVVDISGEEHALKALADLATVVEPDVCVLVIGEHEGMEFYREITRGLGAADYLPKPLARDLVTRHFGGFVMGRAPSSTSAMGGRVLAVTGVRGGCGASSIATNLAWHFGVTLRHHTVLVDPDLYRGNAAFLLNLPPGDGLVAALESPLRIDTLLAERAAQPAAERLHVLAGESSVGSLPVYATGAAETLINALRKRYNFIILDVPFAPVPLYRDLLALAHQQVLVMEPSLVSLRDVLRFNAVSTAQGGTPPLIVLNRLGIPGGLTRRQVEDGLKRKVDLVLPDLPRQLRGAANLGEPAVVAIAPYRKVISELSRAVAGAGLLDSLAASAPPEPAAKRKSWFRSGKTK
ncbi:histidine kinase [Acidisphaera sp. S103]|uniref:AAA family ATPase n=1 Tax=Acidisphaera sp. S103 TaxID=1747223 RepID=UPI00131AF127|nr:histidine kinase [Acidisphaera sp. S103]